MANLLRHEYDPVKRQQYYLRTRQLKGRTKKGTAPLAGRKGTAKKTYAQRQKELEARVARLQAKLTQLKEALKLMTEAAQKRSGIDKNTAEKAAEAKYQPKNRSDPTSKYAKTQKQKDAAAEAAEKYRDKNEGLAEQVTDLNNKIKAIRDRIHRLQKTGSVGVSKTTTR